MKQWFFIIIKVKVSSDVATSNLVHAQKQIYFNGLETITKAKIASRKQNPIAKEELSLELDEISKAERQNLQDEAFSQIRLRSMQFWKY